MDAQAFKEHLTNTVASGFTCLGIGLGHRLKLFDVMGQLDGPKPAEEIAEAANCRIEYITAWLNSVVTGKIVEVTEADGQLLYFLPKDRLPYLATAHGNYAGVTREIPLFGGMFDGISGSFEKKNDPTFESSRGALFDLYDELNRNKYTEGFMRYIIGQVPGLYQKLEQGIKVCEVGCGKGLYCRALGQMFPNTTITGFDISEGSVQQAQSDLTAAGVTNVTLLVADAQQLPADWTSTYDYVTATDVVHHASDITQMMSEIYRVLKPGGIFSLFDGNIHANVKDNIGKPVASILYAFNLFLRVPSMFRVHGSQGQEEGHGHSHGGHSHGGHGHHGHGGSHEGQGITMGLENIISPLTKVGFEISEPKDVDQTQDFHIVATKKM